MTATEAKLARIAAGGAPRVMDLFAGCGGLSLGFQSAGAHVVAAVEIDPVAAETHAMNFGGTSGERGGDLARDITVTEPEDLFSDCLQAGVERLVDVLVGGPPCQAFARVGRAKLREVADHPRAFALDERGDLYLRYLHYVRVLDPLAIVMENVPDALNWAGHNIAEEVAEVLDELGYVARYSLLNSVFYGVPEMRERMFLVALKRELAADPEFPQPSHYVELPVGYHGTRAVALKHVRPGLMFPGHYVDPPVASSSLEPAVTARKAIEDLAIIDQHLKGNMPRGARRFTERSGYRSDIQPSAYAQHMRTWPGFESPGWVSDHVIRSLPRDYEIFRRMQPGDQYPQAYAVAVGLYQETAAGLVAAGRLGADDAHGMDRLRAQIVPPYDPGKFPNKWRKMEPDHPARTLMAHLGKDSYSHIHYDSDQARTISVREAARLQSFPDGFRFAGTMNPAFRQIGNAVPPLLVKPLAEVIVGQVAAAAGRLVDGPSAGLQRSPRPQLRPWPRDEGLA